MIRRMRLIAVATALGAGIAALALLPGDGNGSRADADEMALASIASPNPDLLRRLDAEVSVRPKAPPAEPVKVAAVQPAPIAPSPAPPTPTADPSLRPGLVGPTAVNLRAGPSTASQTISVLKPGEALQVGEANGGWMKVTRADGSTGWIYSTYLAGNTPEAAAPAAVSTPAPQRVASAAPRAVIRGEGDLQNRTARLASRLPAYAKPRDSAPSIFSFEPGDEVRIAEVRGSWLRVETDDGTSAWIRR